MKLRMPVYLFLVFGLVLGAFPARGSTLSEHDLRLAKFQQIKRQMIMSRAQQKILKARVAAKKKLPKGMRVMPSRRNEPVERILTASAAAKSVTRTSSDPTVGGSFPANVRVNNPAADLFTNAGQGEPSVAAFGNNAVMAWNDGDGFDRSSPDDQLIGYGTSTNGGASWTDGGRLPQRAGFPLWVWSSDPVVAVNETTGEFLLVGLFFPDGFPPSSGGTGTLNGIAFVKGTFTGGVFTWGTPVVVIQGSNSTVYYDKPWFAVDPTSGNIYITYTKFTVTGDQIEIVRSTTGGSSWTSPAVLSASADNGFVQGSRVGVGPNGEVYAVWQAVNQFGPKDWFKLRKSTNLGVSFGTEVQVADYYSNFGGGSPGFNRERGITYPGLAIDRTQGPDRGRVYVTWNECFNFYQSDIDGGLGAISELEAPNQSGQNNKFAVARQFTPGNTLRGMISDINTDVDIYRFTATQGQRFVFYCDSLSGSLNLRFLLFCSDTTTNLSGSSLDFADPDGLYGGLIVWTAPVAGNYYLKLNAWVATSVAGQHGYRVRTALHAPLGSDRARDHRDIFVTSSSNGLTWPISGTGAPTRVNDDAAWFDNWLPEVAVTGHSRVFATWFDWRDSNPLRCGGESSLHLYRSDNTGTTWTDLGAITDAVTNWSSVGSNVAPNQGDYVALFANQTSLIPVWADGRDANPNVYTVTIPTVTPALASLAASRIEAGRVELDWLARDYAGQSARLDRRDASGAWTVIDERPVDATGHVVFVDASVTRGGSYAYRLAFADGRGGFEYTSEAEITVPSGLTLALGAPQPNPAVRELWLTITLPSADPATLQLVDVAGRVVRSRDVGALGAGVHRVNLGEGQPLPTGLYLVRLRQGDRTLTTRASVIR